MAPSTLTDLGLPPNLLSLARVPLAVVFPLAAATPEGAMSVILLAGATDVLDGWWARRAHQETALGRVVDGFADKVFAASVIGTLTLSGRLPLWGVPLLAAREIVELGTLGVTLAIPGRARARLHAQRSSRLGKIATIGQFVAIAAAIAAPKALPVTLAAAGALGIAAGLAYALREARAPSR